MADSTTVAFRMLELIALLFPVVALLLQLQHRAADSDDLQLMGLTAGVGMLALLGAAFLSISGHLFVVANLPPLLQLPIILVAVTSFFAPVLALLSSQYALEAVSNAFLEARSRPERTVESMRVAVNRIRGRR